MELIEPWEEVESNPFLNFKSKQLRKRESPKVIKRQTSLNLAKNWKSIEKNAVSRESKVLPVMDIGKLNIIRRASYSTAKLKNKAESSVGAGNAELRHSEKMLPSVKRELQI